MSDTLFGIEGDVEFSSSEREIDAFLDNPVWRDIVALVEDRITLATDELLSATNLQAVGILQGEINSCKSFVGLPEFIAKVQKLEANINSPDNHGQNY